MRTTLADRPGALASLADQCGAAGVNILGLQIFPGIDAVTDELVLRSPHDWGMADVALMVENAGGRDVTVAPCTAHALVDQVTRHLHAVRHVLDEPAAVADILADLLDADPPETDPEEDGLAALKDDLSIEVGDETVVLRRAAEFTPTEEARASAFAAVAGELLALGAKEPPRLVPDPSTQEPRYRIATNQDASALSSMAQRCSAPTLAGRFGIPLATLQPRLARRLLAAGPAVVAEVGTEIVGLATLTAGRPAEVSLLVEDGWQGRGIGARLLSLAARLAKTRGADELVLQSAFNDDAVPRLASAAGLHGRARFERGRTVLTVPLRRVSPLLQIVEGPVGQRDRGPLDPAPA